MLGLCFKLLKIWIQKYQGLKWIICSNFLNHYPFFQQENKEIFKVHRIIISFSVYISNSFIQNISLIRFVLIWILSWLLSVCKVQSILWQQWLLRIHHGHHWHKLLLKVNVLILRTWSCSILSWKPWKLWILSGQHTNSSWETWKLRIKAWLKRIEPCCLPIVLLSLEKLTTALICIWIQTLTH